MLSRLKESDFRVLRGPFEYGRQRPEGLAINLLLSIFLQILLFYLTYGVVAELTTFPYKDNLYHIHLVVTSILILLSVLFSVPKIYKSVTGQRIQYLVVILVSQNLFGVFLYICALFIISVEGHIITKKTVMTTTYITLAIGMLIFIASYIRFYISLNKGDYRNESKKDELRSKQEFNIKSILPIVIIGSIAIVYALQFMVRNAYLIRFDDILIVLIGIGVFNTMLFILPEQLVILYCKHRFDSFNYSKNGKLNSIGKMGA